MSGSFPILVVDNGGYTIKALYIPDPCNTESMPPRHAVIPNCVGAASFAGRGIVGEQIFKLPHFHGFMVRRPVDRGFIVDAALQSYVWEYLLQVFAIADESTVELLLTVPFSAPKQVGDVLYYLVTQRFKFRAVTFVSSTFLALFAASTIASDKSDDDDSAADSSRVLGPDATTTVPGNSNPVAAGCAIVVDFGFSATTIVPYIDFMPLLDAVVRIDVGGKLMSNRLKELISFTQINMTEDGWLVNHIMERCCRVELDPRSSLRSYQKYHHNHQRQQQQQQQRRGGAEIRYYLPTVLPLMPLGCREGDLAKFLVAAGGDAGSIDKQSLQFVTLRHEAFLIPELLFHPADVGIQQAGVAEAMTRGAAHRGSLRDAPSLQSALLRHVVVFGGTTKFSNLRARLNAELQQVLEKCDSTPLQPLMKRDHVMPRVISEGVDESDKNGYAADDSELQPLYGALLLLTLPNNSKHLERVRYYGHVDLSSLHSAKSTHGRAQIQRTYETFMTALRQIV